MAQWKVRLSGHDYDLKDLSRKFNHSHLNVEKDKDTYYLKSSDFDLLTEASSVRSRSIELLQLINGIAEVTSEGFCSVSIGEIVQVDAGGKGIHLIDMQIISEVRVRAEGTLHLPGQVKSGHARKAQDEEKVSIALVNIASNNSKVARALRIFGNREHNWDNLYKVYEAIEHDIGRNQIISESWASDKQITRFTRTANNALVVGDDARHGHEKYDPPKKPMSLQEAESFIRGLLRNWLHSKI